MIAVGAGIGQNVHLHRSQITIAARTDFDANAHRMTGRRADELLFASKFKFDRLAGLECGKRNDVLDQHFLLGAEAAAHALAEDADLGRIELENSPKRAARQKRRLCARPDIEAPGVVEPSNGAVSFQMSVLRARCAVSRLVHDVGVGKTFSTSPIWPCTSARMFRLGLSIRTR